MRLICRLFGHDWLPLFHWEDCRCNRFCRGQFRVEDETICRRCHDATLPAPPHFPHEWPDDVPRMVLRPWKRNEAHDYLLAIVVALVLAAMIGFALDWVLP